MDSNARLRQRVLRLIKHGVSQKVLAAKMGMMPSTFSRWLNKKPGMNPASLLALDGFNAYVQELSDALSDSEPTSRPAPLREQERDRKPDHASAPAGRQTVSEPTRQKGGHRRDRQT